MSATAFPKELIAIRDKVKLIYKYREDIGRIAQQAGLDIGSIAFSFISNITWMSTLVVAHNSKSMDALQAIIVQENPNSGLEPLFFAYNSAYQARLIPDELEGQELFAAQLRANLAVAGIFFTIIIVALLWLYFSLNPPKFFTPSSGPLRIQRGLELDDSHFNVGVAQFCPDETLGAETSALLDSSTTNYPSHIITAIKGISSTLNIHPIYPDQLKLDCETAFDEDGIAEIRRIAEEQGLHMLIYGRFVPGGARDYQVQPYFMGLGDTIANSAPELLDLQRLGTPQVVDTSNPVFTSGERAKIEQKAQSLIRLLEGIFTLDALDYAGATQILCPNAGVVELRILYTLFCAHALSTDTFIRLDEIRAQAGEGNPISLMETFSKSIESYQSITDVSTRARSGLAALYVAIYSSGNMYDLDFCDRVQENQLLQDAAALTEELPAPDANAPVPLYTTVSMTKTWAHIQVYQGFCAPLEQREAAWHRAYDTYQWIEAYPQEKIDRRLWPSILIEVHLMHGHLSYLYHVDAAAYDPPALVVSPYFPVQPDEARADAYIHYKEGLKLVADNLSDPLAYRLGMFHAPWAFDIYAAEDDCPAIGEFLETFAPPDSDSSANMRSMLLDAMDQELRRKCTL